MKLKQLFFKTAKWLVALPLIVSTIFFWLSWVELSEVFSNRTVPSFLPDEMKKSSSLSSQEIEQLRVEFNKEEILLTMAGAGTIISILFANFVFGSRKITLSFENFFAFGALSLSLASIWHGYQALTELKWLVMYEVGSQYWFDSRLFSFQLNQKFLFLLGAVPSMSAFILSRIRFFE